LGLGGANPQDSAGRFQRSALPYASLACSFSTAATATSSVATWRPTSGEAGACHRSNRPIVVETATRQAEESIDGASRHLRVSIVTEVATYDYPPLLLPAPGRSPSGLIWSTPFSPPSHSATVLIRGRVFLNRKPKLATLVETFRPSGLREPKFVSSQSSLPRRAIAAGNRNVVRDIDLIFCAPLRRVLAVFEASAFYQAPLARHMCFRPQLTSQQNWAIR
jgi:hypothetical protein